MSGADLKIDEEELKLLLALCCEESSRCAHELVTDKVDGEVRRLSKKRLVASEGPVSYTHLTLPTKA